MSWTKGQLANEALGELGLADYVFDLSPEERQKAIRRLDSMMATWEALGIKLGYQTPGADGSKESDDSGLPDTAIETVFLNLAARLAPSYGKQLSADSRRSARQGFDILLVDAAQPGQQQQLSTMPIGAGARHQRVTYRPFFPPNTHDSLQVTPGGDLDLSE